MDHHMLAEVLYAPWGLKLHVDSSTRAILGRDDCLPNDTVAWQPRDQSIQYPHFGEKNRNLARDTRVDWANI